MDDQVWLRHRDYLADSIWLRDVCYHNLYVTHTWCKSVKVLVTCYPKQLCLRIADSTIFHQVAAHKACTPCDEDARRNRHCFSATFHPWTWHHAWASVHSEFLKQRFISCETYLRFGGKLEINCKSFSVIILTSSSNVTRGRQPNRWRALDASPIK